MTSLYSSHYKEVPKEIQKSKNRENKETWRLKSPAFSPLNDFAGVACSICSLVLYSNLTNDFKKGNPAEIFWKYFQNKWFSWSYKTTNLTEKWRNCWVFWRKSRYFDWFKYGFSITPTEFITYFQNISAGSPFSSRLNESFTKLIWLKILCLTISLWK